MNKSSSGWLRFRKSSLKTAYKGFYVFVESTCSFFSCFHSNSEQSSRVYQEKERVWERELRRIKAVHESRLRAGAQKAMKLEQMLMMQTYQLQQDKKRLCDEADGARQEADRLRARLEDTEWTLCQKTGEIALLKTQLKDAQVLF